MEKTEKLEKYPMENKAMPVYVVSTDDETGIVDAIVATMGNLDEKGDIGEMGMFRKTINERGHLVQVLNNHRAERLEDVLGKSLELREVGRDQLPTEILSKHPEVTGGLFTKTQYQIDTPEGLSAYRKIKSGAVKQYSFGFKTTQAVYDKVQREGKTLNVRRLKEVALFEYGPVIFPANNATTTLSVKSIEDISGYRDAAQGQTERCDSCRFYSAIQDGRGFCNRFDAIVNPAYLCDSYKPEGKSDETDLEEKAGAVLNKRNRERMKKAMQEIEAVLKEAGMYGDDDENSMPEHMGMMNLAPAKDEKQDALEDHEHKAGPQSAPTSQERERLLKQIELELTELELLEVQPNAWDTSKRDGGTVA